MKPNPIAEKNILTVVMPYLFKNIMVSVDKMSYRNNLIKI